MPTHSSNAPKSQHEVRFVPPSDVRQELLNKVQGRHSNFSIRPSSQMQIPSAYSLVTLPALVRAFSVCVCRGAIWMTLEMSSNDTCSSAPPPAPLRSTFWARRCTEPCPCQSS